MKRLIIHHFDQNGHAMVRFGQDIRILAVYDERPELDGMDAGRAVGMEDAGIRISSDFDSILREHGEEADMMVTTGEGLYFTKKRNVSDWKANVRKAINAGLGIYSMSRLYYGRDTSDLKKLASDSGVEFIEASDPDGWRALIPFAVRAKEEGIKPPRVVFSGTSMNSGKMTAMLTLKRVLEGMGKRVGVVGTEPCSVFVGADIQVQPHFFPTVRGAPSIFGAVKKVELEKRPDIILIGNQTGLRASVLDIRECRAGAVVAWQILLGSDPSKVVLCSKWSNTQEIGPHLELIRSSIGAPVVANAINGSGCEKEKLKGILAGVEKSSGLPALDVISTPGRLKGLAGLILK
jgi:uncharacterized NAD-dependent epimerase/dehydratase family protein